MKSPAFRYDADMRRAFSLVEVMITVALVGVLAAIGVSSWRNSQYRTLRAEIPPNVAAIRQAQLAYFATWDTFVEDATWYPSDLTGGGGDRQPTDWPASGSAGGFDTIGWRPQGAVRGRYSLSLGDQTQFQVDGKCDVDGDGEVASYYATEDNPGEWDSVTVY
ncbi:MAG: prepilin-type N-terminal cleavage/methylation domain-containing protein [Deltaproteobacteria bacterium]|nr:prepilin-type N-terminal cleavage/methylation domain-containing protein [Deltaproteobacteria bacterium]